LKPSKNQNKKKNPRWGTGEQKKDIEKGWGPQKKKERGPRGAMDSARPRDKEREPQKAR